ncbi:uncharacterized protein LOC121198193 isoform X1 [Lates japonicus]
MLLDKPEEPMESDASAVNQDHCYTLPFPVSHHSPVASPVSSNILSASQPEASTTDACSPEAVHIKASVNDTYSKPGKISCLHQPERHLTLMLIMRPQSRREV